jgi:hypothetical protein
MPPKKAPTKKSAKRSKNDDLSFVPNTDSADESAASKSIAQLLEKNTKKRKQAPQLDQQIALLKKARPQDFAPIQWDSAQTGILELLVNGIEPIGASSLAGLFYLLNFSIIYFSIICFLNLNC